MLLGIAVGASIVMLTLWWLQRRTGDAGVVDVGWAASLGAAAVFCGLLGDGNPWRRGLIALMGGAWGFRLALHLLWDRVLWGSEDGRYQMMRERFGSRVQTVFLYFFLAQALLVVLLSAPLILAAGDARPAPDLWDALGLFIWALGLWGESTADAQLKRFKRNPARTGQVCRVGLWRYSRHPNYFFEWWMWIGFALVASGSAVGWIAWTAPSIDPAFHLETDRNSPNRSAGDSIAR